MSRPRYRSSRNWRRERSFSRHFGRRRSRSRNRSRREEVRWDPGGRYRRYSRERHRAAIRAPPDRDRRRLHRSLSRRYRAPEYDRRGSSYYHRRAREADYYRQRSTSNKVIRRGRAVSPGPRRSRQRSRDRDRHRRLRSPRSHSRIVRKNSRRAERRSVSASRGHSEDP